MRSIRPGKDREKSQTVKEIALQDNLPDRLTIKQVGELMYESNQDQKNLYSNLIEACKEGRLKHEGSVDEKDWLVRFDVLEELGSIEFGLAAENDYYDVVDPPEAFIHKDDLKSYFQTEKFWPIKDCLLENWWNQKAQNKTQPIQEVRNEEFKAYLKKMGKAYLDGLTVGQIYKELYSTGKPWVIAFNTFDKWWTKQKIYKKT